VRLVTELADPLTHNAWLGALWGRERSPGYRKSTNHHRQAVNGWWLTVGGRRRPATRPHVRRVARPIGRLAATRADRRVPRAASRLRGTDLQTAGPEAGWRLGDADRRATAMLKQMKDASTSRRPNNAIEGASIKPPGYLVPLEETAWVIKEFCSCAYYGACIHTPPPPAIRSFTSSRLYPSSAMHSMCGSAAPSNHLATTLRSEPAGTGWWRGRSSRTSLRVYLRSDVNQLC
jgi:hypothetical protein